MTQNTFCHILVIHVNRKSKNIGGTRAPLLPVLLVNVSHGNLECHSFLFLRILDGWAENTLFPCVNLNYWLRKMKQVKVRLTLFQSLNFYLEMAVCLLSLSLLPGTPDTPISLYLKNMTEMERKELLTFFLLIISPLHVFLCLILHYLLLKYIFLKTSNFC